MDAGCQDRHGPAGRGGKQGKAKRGKMRSPVCGLSDNANRLSHITVLFPLFQRFAGGLLVITGAEESEVWKEG